MAGRAFAGVVPHRAGAKDHRRPRSRPPASGRGRPRRTPAKAPDATTASHPPAKRPSIFARFAESAATVAGAPAFFTGCVLGIVLWAGFGPAFHYSDTWQLVINTTTSVVTFLMVALLQNSARRSDRALHAKLDAIADALRDFMVKAPYRLERDVEELEQAIGLEQVERPAAQRSKG